MKQRDTSSGNYGHGNYMGVSGGMGRGGHSQEAIPQSQGRRDPQMLGALYNDHKETTKVNWKNFTDKAQAYKNITYSVTFRVQIKVNFGETICVLGSIPELGKWSEYKHHLKWTDGNIWESITPLVTHSYYFQYKYALLDKNGTDLINWEKGVDRLADLEIMPDYSQAKQTGLYNTPLSGPELSQMNRQSTSSGIKQVHYNDVWEQYNMSFTIWHPMENMHEEWIFDNNRAHDIQMHKLPRVINWMDVKYGKTMQPIQCTMKVDQRDGSNVGMFQSSDDQIFSYNFIRKTSNGIISERDPKRTIAIENPHNYRGQLGANQTCFHGKSNKVFIVNGWMHKADGNFLNQFFFQQIANSGVFMGSYPLYEMDVQRLQASGITAVLNIMDQMDVTQRGINSDKIMQFYRNKGINVVVNFGITDENVDTYAEQLFQASKHLYDLVDVKGHRVYLHDTTGVSRAPTLFLCYQALFMKSNQPPNDMLKDLKKFYQFAGPNLQMITRVLDDNRSFLDKQRARFLEDEKRRKREAEEQEMRESLKKAQDEAECMRLKRLKEEESERLRLQRLQFEKDEKARLKKMEEEERERLRQLKLKDERDRIDQKKLDDEEAHRALKRKLAEEEAKREAEKMRLKQEAELKEEQIRLQRLAMEAARDAQRIKKEQEEAEEQERLRQIRLAREEAERKKRSQDEDDERERLRLLRLAEHEEAERLRKIKAAQQESERLRLERQTVEEENMLRQQKRLEQEEMERERLKKQAEDEAQQLLSRLKVIEEEEAERLRKKRLAEYEFQVQTEKIKKLMDQEIASKMRGKLQGKLGGIAKIELVNEPSKQVPSNNVLKVKSKAPHTLIEESYNYYAPVIYEQPAFGDLALLGITEYELDKQCDDLFSQTPIKFQPRKGNKIDEKIRFYIQELNITIPIDYIKGDLYLIGSDRLNIKQNSNNDSLMVRVGGGYVKFEEHFEKYDRYYQRMLVVHMIKSGESLEWVLEQLKANKKITNQLVEFQTGSSATSKFRKNCSRNSLSPIPRSPTTGGTRQSRLELSGNSAFGSSTPTGRSSAQLRSKMPSSSSIYPLKQHHIIKYQE